MSICHSLQDVTYIGSSSYGGRGLFASVDLPKGTILFDNGTKDSSMYNEVLFARDYITFMNDADMIYPNNWTYDELYSKFTLYERTNKCNASVIANSDDIILKQNVLKDQELTKRYDLRKWTYWFILDIYERNPFGKIYKLPSEDGPSEVNLVSEDTNNLFQVISKLGYKSFIDRSIERYNSNTDRKYPLEGLGDAFSVNDL